MQNPPGWPAFAGHDNGAQSNCWNGWIGSAELIFPEVHGEELDMLGPIKVGRGYRFAFSFSVSSNEILADLAD